MLGILLTSLVNIMNKFKTPAFVKFAAAFFQLQLLSAPRRLVVGERETLQLLAAPDGHATSGSCQADANASIDCWFSTKGCTSKAEAHWFAVELTPQNSPGAFFDKEMHNGTSPRSNYSACSYS